MPILLATWEKPGPIALQAAWAKWQSSNELLDAIESGLAACELDPTLIAIGLGSLPNADGEIELDAAMMDGRDLSAGAVCSVRGIVPAISVARRVKERTPHVMLAGEQARRFAIEEGFAPRNLMTHECIEHYQAWVEGRQDFEYVHSIEESHDTVTMLGWDGQGHTVAASSTSGLAYKLPGRVGDSPIVGAGIYADDEIGCAGATGWGEELWKACASFRTVEAMGRGLSADEACEETIRHLSRRQPQSLELPCVVLAMRNDGDFGAAVSKGVFHLWSCVDGEVDVRVYEGICA
jgi:isoaspartyl peptidase/L-asparaginase-like protein (Ntn-hydrolase superfamily)